ncbi:lipid droplet-associated hydrolase [Ipomoea triloba]|uniref:lipid droplet-associated hydrolase n=1 Tax=Ipomoea triloba TaxID=35885 RepID=UPI00125DBA01|nr:lipid droplet-associated hydrolase [Ipomoea triloba]
MLFSIASPLAQSLRPSSRRLISSSCRISRMVLENSSLITKKQHANFRLCNVSGYKTDLLEVHAQDPKLHVVFIPGNPGVVSFYVDFIESLYELLGGTASITAIQHISHGKKNWEYGRLFSLKAQIDHKMNFIEQELHNVEVPIVLVGHSIGSYISLEIFKRSRKKMGFCIGLYPFLTVNTKSWTQFFIKKIAASRSISAVLSSVIAFLGMLPTWFSRSLVKKLVGKFWSPAAVEALCTHILQFHTMQNVLFMAMTEFDKLSDTLDWSFMRQKKNQMAFLFGNDDHWGPTHLLDEIAEKVPGASLMLEQAGHSHAFSCTKDGSVWVAQYVASLIKRHIS